MQNVISRRYAITAIIIALTAGAHAQGPAPSPLISLPSPPPAKVPMVAAQPSPAPLFTRQDFETFLDALIHEPFIEGLPTSRIWRGSHNQPLAPLSALGRERFEHFIDADSGIGAQKGRLQFSVAEGQIWYIGIPQRGDLEALRRAVEAKGIF